MIHINTVNINVQMPCDEPGPTSALGDELLHAMAESLFAEQTEELDSEGEVQPPSNPARMNSLQQQQADAWIAVCQLLTKLRPGCFNGQGSGVEQALQAIRTMAEKQASAESQFV